MSITSKQYAAAEKAIRSSCPNRAFPHIPDNCWVDSTMFGLTYSADLGKVLRSALLGCLENLRASNISTIDSFFAHIKKWQLEPIWNTYITRMLLYFLFEERAEDHLTCPIVSKWVEDFRKKTLVDAKYTPRQVAHLKGGITQNAIFAILSSLSISTDIIVERIDYEKTTPKLRHYYTGETLKHVGNTLSTKGYDRRIGHYVVKSSGKVGHVIIALLCEGDLYLYDNNFGIKTLKNISVLPETITIHYDKHQIRGDKTWYVNNIEYKLQFGGNVKSIVQTLHKTGAIDEKKEVEKPDSTYYLYTKQFYDRVRRGEDILAKMQGAPRPKRLTAIDTPHIADIPAGSPLINTPSTVAESENENENENEIVEEVEEGKRISKFATCIRQVSATAPYKRSMMFNAPGEGPDPETLSTMSSKFTSLLNMIHSLDDRDLREHGTRFKHFIFTDLRDSKFGAKAIASFLRAHGFDILVKAEKGFQRRKVRKDGMEVLGEDGKPVYQMIPTKKLKINLAPHPAVQGGSDRVGVLQGNPLWKSPLGVDVRKKMLAVFNSRPDNIHGEQLRIMVLDSKFKEGIDLYDVKYVHLMEPQITEADLKQAVGRATRFCGQRGLQFVPNVGWNMDVYMYETQFGTVYPFRKEGDKTVFDAHAYMMTHSGMDLGLLELTRNLTVLAIKSAVDYDLTYKINNFKKQSEIYDKTDLKEALVVSVEQVGGKPKVKVIPMEQVDLKKCGTRSNKFFPFSVAAIRKALRARKVRVPATAKRNDLCSMLEANPIVLQDLLGLRVQKAKTPEPLVSVPASISLPAGPRPSLETASPVMPSGPRPSMALDQIPSAPRPSLETVSPAFPAGPPPSMITPTPNTPTPVEDLFPPPPTLKEIEDLPDLADFFRAHEVAFEANYAAHHASFGEFQEYIRDKYAAFGWDAPIVANGCETIPKPGQPVAFSQSQDFVRHYLTPASPFRGLLAWHSVGTGKTCTAIATATSTFEKEGYSILWVTRNSLMADVWKNMFGAVCSIPLQERIAAGKPLPARGQRRLVGKSWFDPISYRSLQNALIPMKKGTVNKLGGLLKERNGADPLRRTFLIIDEVHKLMDGDLKPSEAADFDKIVGAIHNSYKVSGADSVRVLLMTATPITDNPEGLFRLMNVLIPDASKRFPDFQEFRKTYTSADGKLTPEGETYFQQRAKGLISYLNREYDPSTFAQPQFHSIPIPASGAVLASDAELVARCVEEEGDEEEEDVLECDVGDLKAQLAAELADLAETGLARKELADRKRTLRASYKDRIDACKKLEKERTRKKPIHKIGLCLTAASKTRKNVWKLSQQKAAKKCFKKAPGEAMKFTSVAELKKMAKGMLETRKTRKSKKSTQSVNTTRATRGPAEA